MSIKAAVFGLGNIGHYAVEALEAAPDFECLGIVRRASSLGKDPLSLRGLTDFPGMDALIEHRGRPDVVLVCAPSREVPATVEDLLTRGLNTVDSFDIHDRVVETLTAMQAQAQKGKAVAVMSAGWDPGSDSALRALFEAMIPVGTSFTNFGRGRSMGHSVAARAIEGVADATAITIPLGGGRHSRLVYIVLKKGADFEAVRQRIQADPYFSHDPLELRQVQAAELPFVADASHGVLLERLGASGMTSNQQIRFDMRINNPALTAQIMVSCARAAVRFAAEGKHGAFTMIDIPPVMLLAGERMHHIAHLV